MSNLLIALIVVYIATVIIQIGYCISCYANDITYQNTTGITILILLVIFAPIMILLEIGVALMFIRINKE